MMPNIKSAKKRVLVAERNAARNKAYNSALKTSIKKANAAIENNDADKAERQRITAEAQAAVKKIDMAQSKGLLHKNTAAHKKSALAVKLNAAK